MIQKDEILVFLANNKELFSKQFNIIKIGIFGSFARDEQTEKSDIDIIIDMPRDTDNIFEKRMALKETISKHFSKSVDVWPRKSNKTTFQRTNFKRSNMCLKGTLQYFG